MATVFERIIRGEIPSVRLYEDPLCLAILDINPVKKGHSLVICKEPLATIEDVPDATLGHMMGVVKLIDRRLRAVLGCDATNIVINNGEAAGQAVPQLHIHIIPRYKTEDKRPPIPHEKYSDGEMAALGARLRLGQEEGA